MPRASLEELSDLFQPTVGPFVLLRCLELVPEFAQARQRLLRACGPLWAHLSAEIEGAVLVVDRGGDPKLVLGNLLALEDDPEVASRWQAYHEGLYALANPLGPPEMFIPLMQAEDLRSLGGLGLLEARAVAWLRSDPASDQIHWFWCLWRKMEASMLELMGVNSSLQLLQTGASTRCRQELMRMGRRLQRRITHPDPVLLIACWIRVKVFGDTVDQLAQELGKSSEWVQDLVQRGNKLLGLRPRGGRPRRDGSPLRAWESFMVTPKTGG